MNKYLYKIVLYFLRVVPMLLALSCALNNILCYFYIDIHVLSYISGIGFIPLIFLYLSSYLYHFCECYRMFLYYVAINNAINIYDYEFGLPISAKEYLMINLVLIAITLFSVLYIHIREHKK